MFKPLQKYVSRTTSLPLLPVEHWSLCGERPCGWLTVLKAVTRCIFSPLYLQRLRRSLGIHLRIHLSAELPDFKDAPPGEIREQSHGHHAISISDQVNTLYNKIMTQWNWLNFCLGVCLGWPTDLLRSPVFLTSSQWEPVACSYCSQMLFISQYIHNSSHCFSTLLQ